MSTLPILSDTIVALATAPGTAAIHVIRMSGAKSISIANLVFSKDITTAEGYTLHFGEIRGPNGESVDEVLLSVFKAPRSYTKEDSIEISCHGSSYIVQQIINLLLENGARLANAGEFTMRAFLNGAMDLSQAEAVADLIAADSAAAHGLALNQMKGGFSDEIKGLRQELVDFASLIELELDFGEEDVTFADRSKLLVLVDKISQVLDRLITSFQLGNVIKKGVSTVIAGRPNAGKSTLLNALLNEERAIVSEIAGTTRDTIEESLFINGIQFRLIDTAGIRRTQDQIEKLGVDRTIEKIERSTVVIYVFDVTESKPADVWRDVSLFLNNSKAITTGSKQVFVANKMDLNPYTQPKDYYHTDLITNDNLITASAKNKMNIDYLKDVLFRAVVNDSSLLDASVVSNARHHKALYESKAAMDRVRTGITEGISSDFVAMDIRQALHHLGEITGEISSDDLLGNIFSKFCIGK